MLSRLPLLPCRRCCLPGPVALCQEAEGWVDPAAAGEGVDKKKKTKKKGGEKGEADGAAAAPGAPGGREWGMIAKQLASSLSCRHSWCPLALVFMPSPC